ncbi:Endoplasmic reticulum junction formation protein lunapark-B [Chionoecetes opilio]|uniref:Endoplasmic reticulum junction formation protein lunapark n=1 Tax=Chionoecetes opilio TaxID=41210 RepID=A0A8J4XZA3_CHIOP|nr:Endoplasmic reticulum junction formation protein lunapark-B [Chionoecetes opilio]
MLAAHVDLKKAFDSVHLIFAESLEVLVMALEALHEEAKPLGLEVSWLKTKVQKKPSTKELLEKIQQDVENIEEYRSHTQQRQKRLVGYLVLYSIVLYLVAALVCYFYYFPDNLHHRLLYAMPFIFFPFLVYILKRILTWYYSRKISKNEEKLKTLSERKEKILDDVMETETYKVAKEILEKFAPDQLRRNQMHKTSAVSLASPVTSHHSDVRRRVVNQSNQPIISTATSTPQPRVVGGFGVRPPGLPHQTPIFTPRPLMTAQATPVRPGGIGIREEGGGPPGPPMPRPVLPRERGYLDRFIEYLVGDGPANRFALVCRQCESHNGMALQDEFQYLAFRCAYCYYWNPARKQRPSAPRLENLALQRPPPLPTTQDQDEEEEEDQESSSGEEEEEEEEGGEEESESNNSSGEEEEEEGPASSEMSSTKAASSQEGSVEDLAKSVSVPSSDPTTSDEHPLPETEIPSGSTGLTSSSTTPPSSTNEAEEVE